MSNTHGIPRFHETERDTLRTLEHRIRTRQTTFWAALSAWLLQPRNLRMHFRSVLDEGRRAEALRAGFEPIYCYTAGVWPLHAEIEVWSSASGAAELTVWRRGRERGKWSVDTWYSNDSGFSTGEPLRGVVPGHVFSSTGSLARGLANHLDAAAQLRPADGVILSRATPAASRTFVYYQERCLGYGDYGYGLLRTLSLFALLAFLSMIAASFALAVLAG